MSAQCRYKNTNGLHCPEPSVDDSLCYWHSPQTDKTQPDLKQRLEEKVKHNFSLEGYQLANTNLKGIHLVSSKGNTNLSYANLSHANLEGAHLYRVDFQHTSLKKANCNRANLNHTHLDKANLLGIKLEKTSLEHIQWGTKILQETLAFQCLSADKQEEATDNFEQAEEIYRHLRQAFEVQGQFEHAGIFFYREMLMRRQQLPFFSVKRFMSSLSDWSCGYGEKPLRVFRFSLAIIVPCSFLYFFLGIRDGETLIQFQTTQSLWQNLDSYFDCFYFSTATFSKISYGSLNPIGFAKIITMFQSILGAFCIALFIVVFTKRMTR